MVKDNKPEDFTRQLLPFGSLSSLGKGAAQTASADQPGDVDRDAQDQQHPQDAEVAGSAQPGPSKRGRSRRRSGAKNAEAPDPAETSPASEAASGETENVASVTQDSQSAQAQDTSLTQVEHNAEHAHAAPTPAPQRKEVADRRLHVLVTPSELAYLRDLAQRKAGELGKQFGGSASLGQVIRHLIQRHQENEGL